MLSSQSANSGRKRATLHQLLEKQSLLISTVVESKDLETTFERFYGGGVNGKCSLSLNDCSQAYRILQSKPICVKNVTTVLRLPWLASSLANGTVVCGELCRRHTLVERNIDETLCG